MPRGIYKRSEEFKIKNSLKMKKYFQDHPEQRLRMAEQGRRTMVKLRKNPEFRKILSERAKITFKNNKWNVGRKHSEETKHKMSLNNWKRKGEFNEWVDDGGHVRVRFYDENGKKYIKYKHRIVMEQFLGRRLKTREYIHHKNGNKTDNRIENLEIVLSQGHHGIIECPYCQKLFSIK